MFSAIPEEDTISLFNGSSSMTSFSTKTPGSLPKHFVVMPLIEIQLLSEILPRLYFGLLHCEACRRGHPNFGQMSLSISLSKVPLGLTIHKNSKKVESIVV